MKRLNASSVILMSLRVIAGVFGLSFAFVPELEWRFGRLWAIGLMSLGRRTLVAIFRRHDRP